MHQDFFKIHTVDLFQNTFGQTWLNPTTISRDIGKLLLQSSMSMPGMSDHTQEKLHAQTVAFMDILLHAKIKLSTWNIKTLKKYVIWLVKIILKKCSCSGPPDLKVEVAK